MSKPTSTALLRLALSVPAYAKPRYMDSVHPDIKGPSYSTMTPQSDGTKGVWEITVEGRTKGFSSLLEANQSARAWARALVINEFSAAKCLGRKSD